MVMGPAGPETMNDCVGEGQQQFTRNRNQAREFSSQQAIELNPFY
jgi:hypothetical protein